MKLLLLTGKIKQAWNFIKPILTSAKFQELLREDLKPLALKVVEAASHKDLDGDGKADWAVGELREEALKIGIKLAKPYAYILVEAAYKIFKK